MSLHSPNNLIVSLKSYAMSDEATDHRSPASHRAYTVTHDREPSHQQDIGKFDGILRRLLERDRRQHGDLPALEGDTVGGGPFLDVCMGHMLDGLCSILLGRMGSDSLGLQFLERSSE